MNNITGPSALPNPFTPMAFLPPELADQNMVATYVCVGTLAVLIWDILNNIRFDFPSVFAYPVKLPSACLTFSLCTVIYQTARVSIPCSTLCKVLDWAFAVAVASTSLLFLIRVLAIFERNKPVRVFFCVMWLAVLAGVLAPTQGLAGDNIGPTKYCINTRIEMYVGVAGIIPLINDTLVFFAISWRLTRISYASNPRRGGLRTFIRGDYLPTFSRGLLQDGQVYYLTTVTTSLLTVVVFYLTFIPVVYRAMFAVPNAVLMNIMACRVYRRTKSGQYYHKESHNPSSISKTNDTFIPLAFARNGNGKSDLAMKGMSGQGAVIEVVETVEHAGVGDEKARGDGKSPDASVIV